MLKVRDLHGWYGESHVLHGMTFDVEEGHLVTLLGRNGAGKSTCLKALMGVLPRRSGSVLFRDRETISSRPGAIARLGMAWCPEDRGIFSSLSVQENLMLPPVRQADGLTLEEILDLFPNLALHIRKDGTKISGGEQQMLAIARILRTGAKLLLLDEPTEGLAPVIIRQIEAVIHKLKARGYTIILVEQNFQFAAEVADAHHFVEQGRVVDRLDRGEVASSTTKIRAYLGV